jgi:plastocyanin
MRRWAFVASVIAGLAALPAVAGARTQVVYAGGQPAFQAKLAKQYRYGEALAYFPSTVTVHVGDTVAWQGMSLNFHTVDIPARHGEALPLITGTGKILNGVNDFAASPFWFNGKLPQLAFNPALGAPSGGHTYTGASRVDSGLPFGPPSTFKVRFTKPGRYAYFCDVHPGMHGLVTVVPNGKPVPSPAQNAAAVAKEQAADAAVAQRLSRTKIHGNRVILGIASRHVEVLRMFQGVTQVPVGTTITFAMPTGSGETHTATFGPQAYLKTLADGFDKPLIDPRSIFPSSPPGTGPIPLSSTAHGNGFANTGALQSFKGATLPALGSITFTQKGTYNFQCLIHPFMRGVLVVQ